MTKARLHHGDLVSRDGGQVSGVLVQNVNTNRPLFKGEVVCLAIDSYSSFAPYPVNVFHTDDALTRRLVVGVVWKNHILPGETGRVHRIGFVDGLKVYSTAGRPIANGSWLRIPDLTTYTTPPSLHGAAVASDATEEQEFFSFARALEAPSVNNSIRPIKAFLYPGRC
jgi:hypothetical protein